MSTGPLIDRPLLFALGALGTPVLAAALSAVAVRWRASIRDVSLDAGFPAYVGVVLALYALELFTGGVVLGALRGIPAGLGPLAVLAFLLGVYAGPLALGDYLFTRYLTADVDADAASESGDETDAVGRFVTESRVLFLGVHLAIFPSLAPVFVLAA